MTTNNNQPGAKTGTDKGQLAGPGVSTFQISPVIQRAQESFRRDLPELLKKHYRQWVAYYGDRRIGLGPSKTLLCQDCVRRGYPAEEFLVRSVEPDIPREVEGLSDV